VATEVVLQERVEERKASAALSVAVLTIGCKLNQAESEAIAGELSAAGCRVTDRMGPAGAFVINTCAVTHVAERKARHLVRFARRLSPQARIVVTGCYAELASAESLSRLGADLLLGNSKKRQAAALLLRELDNGGAPPASTRLRTRSFVEIQEGCDDVCSFCVVPRLRGRGRSVPVVDVLAALKRAEANGVKEVVLTGTQPGAYGHDRGGEDLAGLLRLVLDETRIPRIRVSSLQPQEMDPALLDLWEDRRLCGHFHVALQSGSDAVLTRMRRRYTTREFAAALESIRARLPDAAVTTDVLVGFPGETEADFAATRWFCEEAGFAALHVFPFSSRPGTLAAKMPDQVSAATRRARVQEMLGQGEELRDRFLARFQGSAAAVLWERQARGNESGVWEGLTTNYIRVLTASEQPLENRLANVRLERRQGSGFWGELQPPVETS
jgi:threonylcarbamoyladenosine tRNA methylthiotransferase MtaB